MGYAAKIRQQNAKWVKAFRQEKAAAIAALYAADSVLLPPQTRRFLRGTAAIRNSWKETREGFTECKFITDSLWSMGKKDSLVGEFGKFTAKPSRGKTMSGKYVVVWQRVGATYKVRVDIAVFDTDD